MKEAQKLGFAMGITERRKLVYHLVRSGLDTEQRRAIYKFRSQGLGVVEIAKMLVNKEGKQISKQAVSKCLSIIDQRVDDYCIARHWMRKPFSQKF